MVATSGFTPPVWMPRRIMARAAARIGTMNTDTLVPTGDCRSRCRRGTPPCPTLGLSQVGRCWSARPRLVKPAKLPIRENSMGMAMTLRIIGRYVTEALSLRDAVDRRGRVELLGHRVQQRQ